MSPFVWGGAEELAAHLCRRLIEFGHQSELVRIPFQWSPPERIPSQMMMAKWLSIHNAERVIALKFPAYLVPHADKTLWILHQYREVYDLAGGLDASLCTDDPATRLRSLVRAADNAAVEESRSVFVNSKITQERLWNFNRRHSEVLLPPVNDPELFVGGESRGYIFAGGRINGMKRQHLLVEAMSYCSPRVRLVIAGPPDSDSDAERLRRSVEQLGLSDRVHLDFRMLSRHEYADYVNHSEAVAYLPVDEDSMGYVAMEGATARKPLITATDSGGIHGLVVDGHTGWVVEPTAESVALAFDLATKDPKKALAFGVASKAHWDSLGVTWEQTIGSLVP